MDGNEEAFMIRNAREKGGAISVDPTHTRYIPRPGDLVMEGHVVLVEVDIPVSPDPWKSVDDSIEEVGWCLQVPENSAWGSEEIERIINHDWSTSISLGS